MASNVVTEGQDTTAQSNDSGTFPEIGGVYLAPAPEIEDEFYEELLRKMQAANP